MGKAKAILPGMSAEAAARPATLNKATVQRFLDHLAATCHVQGAAGAAGASTGAFYKRRRNDPEFAAAWRSAVQAGYERLEEALLARALSEAAIYEAEAGAVTVELVDADRSVATASGDAGEAGDADEAGGTGEARGAAPRGRAGLRLSAGMGGKVARIDVQLALTLLNRRAAIDARGRERYVRRRPTAEEVEKALTAKLDTLSRRLAAPEQ